MSCEHTQPFEPLSDPLSIRQLADLFGFGRQKMADVLHVMPGAEQCGGRWRVPISKMPVAWLLDAGVIVPKLVKLPAKQGQLDRC